MDSRKIKNIMFWIMSIAIIFLVIYLFFFIRSESYECMNGPLVYGVSKYDVDVGEFTCSCSSMNSKIILVTKDGMSLQENNNGIFTTG